MIPHIDTFMDDGATKEEMEDGRRDGQNPRCRYRRACDLRARAGIRQPSEAVNVEFETALDEKAARQALTGAPGVIVVDHRVDGGYVTPVECAGERRGLRQPVSAKDPT